jgi:excisionase family DNA binding protein
MRRTSPHTLLRISAAADLLSVHPRTLRRWLAAGLLESVKLPTGERRVRFEAVQALLTGDVTQQDLRDTPDGGR